MRKSLREVRRNAGRVTRQKVIGQQYGEGVAADHALRAEDRVPQAQLLRLAHEDALHALGNDIAHHVGLRVPALRT